MIQLYLASKSPRRRELLAQLGLAFECIEGSVDESVLDSETPQDYVVRLAKAKAISRQRSRSAIPYTDFGFGYVGGN